MKGFLSNSDQFSDKTVLASRLKDGVGLVGVERMDSAQGESWGTTYLGEGCVLGQVFMSVRPASSLGACQETGWHSEKSVCILSQQLDDCFIILWPKLFHSNQFLLHTQHWNYIQIFFKKKIIAIFSP